MDGFGKRLLYLPCERSRQEISICGCPHDRATGVSLISRKAIPSRCDPIIEGQPYASSAQLQSARSFA